MPNPFEPEPAADTDLPPGHATVPADRYLQAQVLQDLQRKVTHRAKG